MATANNDFKLIGPSHTWWDPTVTLSCCLSPEISAVNMEIQWFKETDCVCVYKNRQVIVGRAYKGRVRLFTQELETGNISLELRDCTESDEGHYLCQVIDGDRRGEITVKMEAWDDEEEEEESSDSDDEEEGDDENDDEEEESSDSSDKEWTEDERMRMKKSALQTVSSVECYSSEVEEFSPELVKKCVDDNSKNKYRFQFPHAGQFKCKLTDLKFMMEREGEVLYSTVSWNSYPLDGLGQKEPAGPLYSIDCHKGLIKYLHLPHSKTSELEMNVAHMAGGYWEITQPLSVTNTHVIIDVEGLSLLGLIKTRPSNADPIEAQVLLFFKKNIGKNRKSKLHMYLLPGDVAAEEVQKKHGKKTHVETSGSCELTPDKKYEPFIKDNNLEFTVQPKSKKFKRDYSPNCQPTFEVIFKTEVDEITIGLLDERKEEVWSREVLLTNTEADSLQVNTAGADFMDQHRETLIQRVPSVMEIADCLKSKKRITDEMYNKMKVSSITSQDQMRLLYSAIDSGGKTVKEKVYKILKKKFPDIVNNLESA